MKTVLTAFNARYSHSSLAIRYIAKYNEDKDIEIAEFTINESIYNSYSALLKKSADIYCFSVYIWNLEITVKVAEMLKKVLPDSIIVFGGPECSYCPDRIFEKYPFVDYVIMGEGEETTGRLIEALESGEFTHTEGIASKSFNGGFAKPMGLEKIIFPYSDESLKKLKNRIVYFETSRGCPFSCSYCLSSTERGIRYFPMEYVKKGFDIFFRNRVPLVKLIDRTFNADPNRAAEIIEYIIENSVCTKVHFEIDPGILTKELTELLISAPKDLFQLEMGIQSANKKTLKSVNRKENLEKVAENVRRLRKADNMHIHLDLIAGLPFEGYSSFACSFNFVYSLNPQMLQLGFLKVLHGTPIEKESSIVHADFPPYEVIKTDWITADEICKLKLIDKAVDEINNSGAFKRTIEKITIENPFAEFEKISQIFDTEISLSRFDIYDKLYEIYGDEIKTELCLDFLEHSPNRAMPSFAKIKYPKDFKKRCNAILSEKYPDLKNGHVRFEPIGNEIYMMDYKAKKLYRV